MTSAFFFSFVMLGLLVRHDVHAQEDRLVGYWNFDKGKESVIHDASGNGHDGLVKDAKWVLGKVNQALRFEQGVFVEIPDHQELRLQKDFTITAWINKMLVSKKGKSMGIVSKSSQDAWKEHVIHTVDFCHTLQAADMDMDGDINVVTGEMEKSDDPDILVNRNYNKPPVEIWENLIRNSKSGSGRK